MLTSSKFQKPFQAQNVVQNRILASNLINFANRNSNQSCQLGLDADYVQAVIWDFPNRGGGEFFIKFWQLMSPIWFSKHIEKL